MSHSLLCTTLIQFSSVSEVTHLLHYSLPAYWQQLVVLPCTFTPQSPNSLLISSLPLPFPTLTSTSTLPYTPIPSSDYTSLPLLPPIPNFPSSFPVSWPLIFSSFYLPLCSHPSNLNHNTPYPPLFSPFFSSPSCHPSILFCLPMHIHYCQNVYLFL